MGTAGEFFQFIRERKKWWLVPVIVMLLSIAGLVWYLGGSAIAPFVYTLF
jgi:hypothetical protein